MGADDSSLHTAADLFFVSTTMLPRPFPSNHTSLGDLAWGDRQLCMMSIDAETLSPTVAAPLLKENIPPGISFRQAHGLRTHKCKASS